MTLHVQNYCTSGIAPVKLTTGDAAGARPITNLNSYWLRVGCIVSIDNIASFSGGFLKTPAYLLGHNLLLVLLPPDFFACFVAEVDQMPDGGAEVAHLGVFDRLFPGPHAIEEFRQVRLGCLRARTCNLLRLRATGVCRRAWTH